MNYYSGLHFEQEPFSNSPDPDLFFNSKQHLEALQQLEISIRLKRGLAVVTGDVGTGKTTISRKLVTRISGDPQMGYFLLLDPGFTTVTDFLGYILTLFTGEEVFPGKGELYIKEQIKSFLFNRGIDEKKITVLIIDEGQKLPLVCLEALRELLNYETNADKLLQTIIFAQKELDSIIEMLPNFKDRINFRYSLSPLGFTETRQMILYRLSCSLVPGTGKSIFSFPAHVGIYLFTGGYPRKIINLCHQVVLSLLIQNRQRAGWFLIRACGLKVFPEKKARIGIKSILPGLLLAAFISFFYWGEPGAVFLRVARVLEKPPVVAIPDAPVALPALTRYAIPLFVKADLPKKEEQTTGPVSVSPMPESYGSLKILRDVTLYNMVGTVYGRFNQKILNSILEANPGILNPDRIQSGISIKFPVIEPVNDPTDQGWTRDSFCILFSRHSNFTAAYGGARTLHAKNVDARVFPLWTTDREFLFLVILNRPFATMEAALAFKRQMPTLASARCAGLFPAENSETLP